MDPFTQAIEQVQYLLIVAVLLGLGLVGLAGLLYILVRWWRFKDREKHSLDFVLLQVAVPRDNEIKIDAAKDKKVSLNTLRQIVSSRYSVNLILKLAKKK